MYKKVKRYYENLQYIKLEGEDPDADYNAVIECIIEDLNFMIEVLVQNDPYRYVKMPDLLENGQPDYRIQMEQSQWLQGHVSM